MWKKGVKTDIYDVAVAGGGTAGVFAAIAAAAAGARTLLIEKNSVLGGTMTAGGVSYPGLFFAWGKQIIGGHCWEAVQRVAALGGAQIPEMTYKSEHHWQQQIRLDKLTLACVLDEMCREHQVCVWLHTSLASANETGSGVTLQLAGKDGLVSVQAKKVIDATGDAQLTRSLGYACDKSGRLQPATLFVRLDNIPDHVATANLAEQVHHAIREQRLPAWSTPGTILGTLSGRSLAFHVACAADSDTTAGRTRLEMDARREALQIVRFLRGLDGLQALHVAEFSLECGVRETNRIVGEYTITARDYISGRRFADAVCNAFYPIDLHEPPYSIKQVFFEEGLYAQVPYRALVPRGSTHLLAAGRIISSDTDANSALRVQAPCMAEGQAAGCAAAIAASENQPVAAVDYHSLCQALERQGAIIPGEV